MDFGLLVPAGGKVRIRPGEIPVFSGFLGAAGGEKEQEQEGDGNSGAREGETAEYPEWLHG